jgi:hypothetical protein
MATILAPETDGEDGSSAVPDLATLSGKRPPQCRLTDTPTPRLYAY